MVMFRQTKLKDRELDGKVSNLPNISVQSNGALIKADAKSLTMISQLGMQVQRLEKENKKLKAELKSQKAAKKKRTKMITSERTTKDRVLQIFQNRSLKIID
jgi:hypothetical protein